MHFRSATKVGLAIVLSVAAFIAVSYFLLGQGLRSKSYPLTVLFKDAQNITTGAEVRMAGVEIGLVDSIGLTPDNMAEVKLRINEQYEIPAGSEFVITAGGLIGEKYVSILPRRDAQARLNPETTVQGQDTVQIEDLMKKASQLASSSDEVIREARLALVDTRVAIRSVSRLLENPNLQRSMNATLGNIETASRRADRTAADFQRMARDLRSITESAGPRTDRMLASAEQSAANIEELTGALSGIISGDDIKSDLGAALHNVRLATESMNRVASNVEKISGDTQYTDDLKATLANVREATAHARQASEAINESVQRLTARFRPRPGGNDNTNAPAPGSLAPHATVDLLQTVDPGRFRADINGVLPFGQNFLFGGIRDLGEANRLNLQMGQTLSNRWNLRYGIYSGYLGAGLDSGLDQEDGWSVNLYRPNRLTADVYGRKRWSEDTSLTFGVENLLRNPTPTVGVRIRR